MTWSPGIIIAGCYVYAVYWFTGTASQWWCWLVGLAICLVVDGLLGVHAVDAPIFKTEKKYVRGVYK